MILPKPLYHVSFDKSLAGTINPQLPAGYDGYVSELSEPEHPRISVAPLISKCILSIYPNIYHLFEEKNYPYVDMYVYKIDASKVKAYLTPESLTKLRFVHDAHITDEYWLLEPVRFTRLPKRVRFYNPQAIENLEYHPFDDKSMEKRILGPNFGKFRIEEI